MLSSRCQPQRSCSVPYSAIWVISRLWMRIRVNLRAIKVIEWRVEEQLAVVKAVSLLMQSRYGNRLPAPDFHIQRPMISLHREQMPQSYVYQEGIHMATTRLKSH